MSDGPHSPPKVETRKEIFAHLRHVTTVSSGVLVVLVAFHEKLPYTPVGNPLLILTAVCFVTAIMGAIFFEGVAVWNLEKDRAYSDLSEKDSLVVGLWCVWVGFFGGNLCLGLYLIAASLAAASITPPGT